MSDVNKTPAKKLDTEDYRNPTDTYHFEIVIESLFESVNT